MKSYLVDIFTNKVQNTSTNIVGLVGTESINCGISNNSLYYIVIKGPPWSCSEFFQLLGRLRRGK